ncbi:DUF4652 domain-containing protein [Clostridium niameyense]|uniref:DUF4652 domain-containing protein n=1 Tax=Clostridium niameyense TaxID=1622073 RepID=UPI00067F0486|nr:DUF4652 domain-containing protein [Clostridium niameyense]
MKKSYLNKAYTLLVLGLISLFLLSGCENNNLASKNAGSEDNKKQEQNVEQKQNKVENKNEYNNKQENETKEENGGKAVAGRKKQVKDKNFNPSFNTPWKQTENKKYSVTIEGKGESAQEEGIGEVYIKDSEGVMWNLDLKDIEPGKTPKYTMWLNNENLMVIIGQANGTVNKGGNLYNINMNTNKVTTIYKSHDHKEEVISVKRQNDSLEKLDLILSLNVYEDDNLTKSHVDEVKFSHDKIKELIK